MNYFNIPDQWNIPKSAMRASIQEMAIDGAQGNEGVAMWLGTYEGQTANVTHVAVLRGPTVRKAPDQLIISSDLINDITDIAIEHQISLIGQIHSHGRLHGTDLSYTDRTYGIAVPGYLSAVAPDYAMYPDTKIEHCGVHIFLPISGWQRLTQKEIAKRIKVDTSRNIEILIAGENGVVHG